MLVPNRICETTNTIGAGRLDGLPDGPYIEHHLAKATGGTGWIGAETWLLDSPVPPDAPVEYFPAGASPRVPVYLMNGFVERNAEFFSAVHDTGAVVVSQLTHVNSTFGPSSVVVSEAYDWVPHTISDDEIEFFVNTYVVAAEKLQAAGTDGIEIHCAHETLSHLFLSPATNHRTDRWGGAARARTAFIREILTRIRLAVGDDVALGIRIGGWETRLGGYGFVEMREMLGHIAEPGLMDFVNVDVGSPVGAPSYVPPSHWSPDDFKDAGKAVKADLDVAVLFSGRVNDPGLAEKLLAENVCDLVGMTRAGIADPEFPNKTRQGKLMEMRRCIGCNRCIGETVHSHSPTRQRLPTCSVNPVVGNEGLWKAGFQPAPQPKRLVVVGGGAAGLETARVAAMRGHQVTLFERSPLLGGQVRIASRAPGRDSFEEFIYFQENQMDLLGVEVRLGYEGTAEDVLALDPDVVVCATGSVPLRPDISGVDQPNVVQGWSVLGGEVEVGARVAVISQEDHMETPCVADFLAGSGRQVEIFHRWTALGREVDRYTMGTMMMRLEQGKVLIHTGRTLVGITGDEIDLISPWTGQAEQIDGFDNIVLVYGSSPDTRLYDDLEDRVERLFLVGSAWVPRQLAEATRHGMKVGLAV